MLPLQSRKTGPTESLTDSSVPSKSLARRSCLTQKSEASQAFYGRRKEIELFDALLQSTRGAIVLHGEHGIGKTELVKQLVVRGRTPQKHKIACDYVRAWPSAFATEPFIDALTVTLDSMERLETAAEKTRDRLKRLATALGEEASAMAGALLTDVAGKLVGKETTDAIKTILRRYQSTKSELDEARIRLASEPRSITRPVNDILQAIHRSNSDLKVVLVFDQFEQISEAAWWILLDLIRSMPEQIYVLAAFRHQAEIMPKNLERLFIEGSRTEGFRARELQGLETEEIRDWIRSERHVDLISPQLSRIRQNSGGFPILLAPWIRRSKSLDPGELKIADLRKSVCQEVMLRITEQPLDLAVIDFLHQLSVLQSPPPIDAGANAYEDLTGVESVAVGAYSELLTKRWLLDGNRQEPWFRHELIKACIEDSLRENERTKLHEKAARFYEALSKQYQKSGDGIPFAIGLGRAYHFHHTAQHKESFDHNVSFAQFAASVGELDVAEESYLRAAKDAEILKDEDAMMRAKGDRASILMTWGKIDEAKRIHEEMLTFFETKGDQGGTATALHQLGIIAEDRGNYDEAERFYKQSLEIKQKIGDQGGVSKSLHQLGIIAEDRGNYDEAERFYKQSREILQKIGDQAGIGRSLGQLGALAETRGQLKEAESCMFRALEIFARIGDKPMQEQASRHLDRIRARLKKEGGPKS